MSEPSSREPDDTVATAPVRERVDGYNRNGVWVPRDTDPDPQPPGWRERLETRFGISLDDRRLWLVSAGALLVLVVLVALVNAGSQARMPGEERDFLAAVEKGQTAVREGNDITLVTAARDRASAVCTLLPRGGVVEDWVGTIDEVGTVFGGKEGQVTVSLGQDVKLRTWSSASEDAKDRTLVDPNSDVYRQLASLESGDKVKFSGAFVAKGATCINETSVFARNGMLTPSFVFGFTAVEPR